MEFMQTRYKELEIDWENKTIGGSEKHFNRKIYGLLKEAMKFTTLFKYDFTKIVEYKNETLEESEFSVTIKTTPTLREPWIYKQY